MKQYNKPELAYAAARRHVGAHGGSAAVIQTDGLPGTYQVGNMHEVRLIASETKVRTCKLFYGITGRLYQKKNPGRSNPIMELETALLCGEGL